MAPDHAVANLPWDQLTEEMHESNRRLMIHLPAKLASAGVDLAHWLGTGLPADGIAIPDLRRDPARLEQLAELEHHRWMAERRLSGWQHGPTRDNLRRRHPDLVPWDQLPEASRRFDREIVLATLEALATVRSTTESPAA
jgi:transposase InsO family protein